MSDEQEKTLNDLTVRLERGSCIGTGACRNAAPEVFELDGQQIVTFTERPEEIGRERLLEAAGLCPVEAILVFSADGEQLVP